MNQKKEEGEQKPHLEKGLGPAGNREVSEAQGREQTNQYRKTDQVLAPHTLCLSPSTKKPAYFILFLFS